MEDLEIMNRMEEVTEKLKTLYSLEKEKEKLEDECKHNIVVITGEDNCYSIDAQCLFCGRKFGSNRSLYGYGNIINISEYCIHWNERQLVEEVKEIYKDIISKNPNLKTEEISKRVKEEMSNRYDGVLKQLNDIAKGVREEMKNKSAT